MVVNKTLFATALQQVWYLENVAPKPVESLRGLGKFWLLRIALQYHPARNIKHQVGFFEGITSEFGHSSAVKKLNEHPGVFSKVSTAVFDHFAVID